MSMTSDNDFDREWAEKERQTLEDQGLGLILENLSYGDVSADGSSVVGKNASLFINGGSNHWRLQLAGQHSISDQDLASSIETLTQIKAECDARSIAFALVIIPEKDLVYPEDSPNCRDITLGDRSVHRLKAAFPGTLYPLSDLCAARNDALLYHRRDSHFNFFGGLVIFNAMAGMLGIDPLDYDHTPNIHAPWQDDLAVKWEPYKTLRRTLKADYDEHIVAEGAPLTGHHMHLTAHDASNDECAVVYGDSYSWNPDAGLARLLTRRFKNVHFIWSRQVNWDLMTELAPTTILMEAAERFLVGGLFRV